MLYFPGLGIKRTLKTDGRAVVASTPRKAGTLRFTCGMDRYDGRIVVVR